MTAETAEATVSRLRAPMQELRLLLERGYGREPALRFVADHHQLLLSDRNVLERVIFPREEAERRSARLVAVEELRGESVLVDGYNVVIGVECLLGGQPLFRCDDGLTRDVAALRGRQRLTGRTREAVDRICRSLSMWGASRATVLLDAQVSRSGELASVFRRSLAGSGLAGDAVTTPRVDRDLRAGAAGTIVCSADRAVVDGSPRVFDLVGALAAEEIDVPSPPPAL